MKLSVFVKGSETKKLSHVTLWENVSTITLV